MEFRIRASSEQFLIFLDFMESNGDLSKPEKRLLADRLWPELVQQLNSCCGGVKKPLEKWKKVYADWKTKTKKKALMIKHGVPSAFEGSTNRQTLTTMEERLLRIMGLPELIGENKIENNSEETKPLAEETEETFNGEEYATQELIYMPVKIEKPDPSEKTMTTVDSNQFNPMDMDEEETKPKLQIPEAKPKLNRRPTKRRRWIPYDRLTRDFAAIEMRRIQLEEMRERRLHEKEMARLKIEAERNELNRILYEHHQKLINTLINVFPKPNNKK